MLKCLLKLFVWLHNVSYKIITKLAVKKEGGIHPKHRIMPYHQFFIDNVGNNDTVLDIGCGNGAVAYDVAGKAKQVVGIDLKESNITHARKHFSRSNLEFITGDVWGYNFGRRFDKIVFSNVLEHIDKRVEFLQRLHGVSDVILLRVPMLDRDWLVIYKKELGLEYRLDPTHFIEYTLEDLQGELQASDWKIDSFSIQFGEFWGVVKSII